MSLNARRDEPKVKTYNDEFSPDDLTRSNVYCTNCNKTFIALFMMNLNGNHEINCPFCAHTHYRVIKNGVVTEDRYQSSAGQTYTVQTYAYQPVSKVSVSYASWLNRTDLDLTT